MFLQFNEQYLFYRIKEMKPMQHCLKHWSNSFILLQIKHRYSRERNKCSSHFRPLKLYTLSTLAVSVSRKIFQLTSSLSSSQWNGSWKNRATRTWRKWLWDTATGTFKVSFSTAARRTAIVEAPCSFFLSASRRLCLLSAKLPRSFRL